MREYRAKFIKILCLILGNGFTKAGILQMPISASGDPGQNFQSMGVDDIDFIKIKMRLYAGVTIQIPLRNLAFNIKRQRLATALSE